MLDIISIMSKSKSDDQIVNSLLEKVNDLSLDNDGINTIVAEIPTGKNLQVENQSQESSNVLVLVCAGSDGEPVRILIYSEAAKLSNTISSMLEGPIQGDDGEVPILNLTVSDLQLAVKVMEKYKGTPVSSDDTPNINIEINSWDKENIPSDMKGLINAFRSANFLSIKIMKEKTGKMIGLAMENMSSEEINSVIGDVAKDYECYNKDINLEEKYAWLSQL